MRRDDRRTPAWVLLGLAVLTMFGMLLGSWQLVLYPSLLIVGVLLAMSMAAKGQLRYGIPVFVTVLLVGLFALLHAMGVDDPSGEGSFLGWDPMTAIYLFVVGPAFLLVGLLFALHDRSSDTAREAVR